MLILDRFEGNYALIEQDGGIIQSVLRSKVASEVKEGDCLVFREGIYEIDIQETQRRREAILRLQKDLWE